MKYILGFVVGLIIVSLALDGLNVDISLFNRVLSVLVLTLLIRFTGV